MNKRLYLLFFLFLLYGCQNKRSNEQGGEGVIEEYLSIVNNWKGLNSHELDYKHLKADDLPKIEKFRNITNTTEISLLKSYIAAQLGFYKMALFELEKIPLDNLENENWIFLKASLQYLLGLKQESISTYRRLLDLLGVRLSTSLSAIGYENFREVKFETLSGIQFEDINLNNEFNNSIKELSKLKITNCLIRKKINHLKYEKRNNLQNNEKEQLNLLAKCLSSASLKASEESTALYDFNALLSNLDNKDLDKRFSESEKYLSSKKNRLIALFDTTCIIEFINAHFRLTQNASKFKKEADDKYYRALRFVTPTLWKKNSSILNTYSPPSIEGFEKAMEPFSAEKFGVNSIVWQLERRFNDFYVILDILKKKSVVYSALAGIILDKDVYTSEVSLYVARNLFDLSDLYSEMVATDDLPQYEINKAKYFIKVGKNNDALYLLKKAENISERIGLKNVLKTIVYNQLIEIYATVDSGTQINKYKVQIINQILIPAIKDSLKADYLKTAFTELAEKDPNIKNFIEDLSRTSFSSYGQRDSANQYKLFFKQEQEKKQVVQIKYEKSIQNIYILIGAFILSLICIYLYYKSREYKKLQKINEELNQKNIALSALKRELSHRVKNNLMAIGSRIQSQIRKLRQKGELDTAFLFMEINSRIQAIQLLHTQLQDSENTNEIGLNRYLTDLATYLMQSGGYQKDQFRVDIKIPGQQTIPVGLASRLGLAITELALNAFKYANVPDKEFALSAWIAGKDQELLFLSVADNGPGLPHNYEPGSGLRIVNTIIEHQMKGSCSLDESAQGTKWLIQIPLSHWQQGDAEEKERG